MTVIIEEYGGKKIGRSVVVIDAQPNKRSISKAVIAYYKEIKNKDVSCWFHDTYTIQGQWYTSVRI